MLRRSRQGFPDKDFNEGFPAKDFNERVKARVSTKISATRSSTYFFNVDFPAEFAGGLQGNQPRNLWAGCPGGRCA
jgi:hypothetical protein